MYLQYYDFEKDKKALQRFHKKSKKLRIALLCGPKSQEDGVYWKNFPFEQTSSGFVYQNLRQLGFEVKVVRNTAKNLEKRLHWADVIFLNAHGEFGEDGTIQGFLEYIAKPYTGPGIYASCLGIDKVRLKKFASRLGFSTPTWVILQEASSREIKDAVGNFGLPIIFKPARGGSSIGLYKALSLRQAISLRKSISASMAQGIEYFAEKFIAGRSLTVSILDLPTQRVALPIIEFLPRTKDLYDQELKIQSQRGEPVVDYPTIKDLSKELYEHIGAIALGICAESECSGFARVDFILDIQNRPHVLEMNTIPGLQKDSNFLLCAEAAGITPGTVLLSLLYRALRRI